MFLQFQNAQRNPLAVHVARVFSFILQVKKELLTYSQINQNLQFDYRYTCNVLYSTIVKTNKNL